MEGGDDGPEVEIGYLSFITLLLVFDTESLVEPLVHYFA